MPFRSELKVEFIRGEIEGILLADLIYYSNQFSIEIVVPEGFISDFASVPGQIILPGLVPKIGRIRDAAVVHDYLYRTCGMNGSLNREVCDLIFKEAALDCGVPAWRADMAHTGVRIGGWKPWRSYSCS